MKSSIAIGFLCLSFLLLGALAPRGDASAASNALELEERVAELEAQLLVLRKEDAAAQARLDQVSRYLEAQAQGGKALASQLDRVEELGFAKGINYESRQVLLAAFRGFTAGLQKGLPAAPRPAAEERGAARQR